MTLLPGQQEYQKVNVDMSGMSRPKKPKPTVPGYDPNTGEYTEGDPSVSKRLTGLLAGDNPYMQQAATIARQGSNRRGLLNSTMNTQAVESARIGAALPIASQEAAQAHSGNLNAQSLRMTDVGQQRDITSREGMQQRDITSREGMLQSEIGSRERLQGADIASREGMQQADITSREGMQQTAIAADERLAQMNLTANQRNAASQMANNFEATYSQMVSAIMNNPDIPAAERQRYLDHAARVRDSNYALVEQFYNIDLQWSAQGQPPAQQPNQPRDRNNSKPTPVAPPPRIVQTPQERRANAMRRADR